MFLTKSIRFSKIDRVEVSVREGDHRGSVHIYLQIERGPRRVSVLLNLRWRCEVLRLTEPVDRGERLYPWQVAFQREFLERCPKVWLENIEKIVNYVALRSLESGEILRESYLKREPLVRRGRR